MKIILNYEQSHIQYNLQHKDIIMRCSYTQTSFHILSKLLVHNCNRNRRCSNDGKRFSINTTFHFFLLSCIELVPQQVDHNTRRSAQIKCVIKPVLNFDSPDLKRSYTIMPQHSMHIEYRDIFVNCRDECLDLLIRFLQQHTIK